MRISCARARRPEPAAARRSPRRRRPAKCGPPASPTCAAAKRARRNRPSGTSTRRSTTPSGRSCSSRRRAGAWRATGMPIRIRRDSRWNVPEPELTLVVNAHGEIVGFCVGNDVASRDIEGENPLYLPQAKVYNGSCALGPGTSRAAPTALRECRDRSRRAAERPAPSSTARPARRRSSARCRNWSSTCGASWTSRTASS